MKIRILCTLILTTAIFNTACDDQIMEWGKDPSHGEITESQLPLELAEKISRYEALNTYTDLTLGVGIGLDLYMNDATYQAIANENFDEVTVGYAMKHGAMVQSDGSLDFTTTDEFMDATKTAGLSVFGHTLIWHSNQNAAYLNGLIAPTIIPGSGGSNSLDNGDFEDGTISNWGGWGGTREVSSEGEGFGNTGYAMKLTRSESGDIWDMQTSYALDEELENGKAYTVSFMAKASASSNVRVQLQDASYNSDAYTFAIGTTWASYQATITVTADGRSKFVFDTGETPATYYFDEVVLYEAPDNMIGNANFEDGTVSDWGGWGGTREISEDGEGYGGSGYAMKLTRSEAGDLWSMQTSYDLGENLENGEEYTVSFMAKASASASIRVQLQDASYNSDAYTFAIGTTWAAYQATITVTADGRYKFVFDTGETPATYYFDEVLLTADDIGSGSTTLEKTDEEKAEIIEDAMESWISGMVGHYKDDIHAWDVVNEPMKESGALRDGDVTDLSDDEFYWVKYLGKDYAVTAFNLARQYGNASDKLFINDYNLEYNLSKCDGLIDYVNYIESQGATVDGIGTQMHITIDSDTAQIVSMFQKLAASGKLIKVSELDISLGTADPTTEQLAEQADMYQFVIDMYRTYIPEAQQYGITAWGISDNEQEHEYWLPDESPNLWDANYERKHAYKGFADGLAGSDVSEGFSGELQGD